jgi:hypothetical protein
VARRFRRLGVFGLPPLLPALGELRQPLLRLALAHHVEQRDLQALAVAVAQLIV